jgi:hypothetical protein
MKSRENPQGMVPTTERTIETLGNGVTREWALDGKAVVFHVKNISRPSLDTWVEAVKQTVQNWTGDTMYIVYDFAVPGMVVLSPYLQSRAKELAALRTEMSAYVAVALPKTFFTQLAVRFVGTVKPNNTIVRLFLSYEEGLDWFEYLLRQKKK